MGLRRRSYSRTKRVRRERGWDESGHDQKNKKMNPEVYKVRREAMQYVYDAKKLLQKKLDVDMPRVTIRITDLTTPESILLGSARMGGKIVWIPEDTVKKYRKFLKEIVYHELLHAVFGVPHDPSCDLMGPHIGSKPMSSAKADKLFLKWAERVNKR